LTDYYKVHFSWDLRGKPFGEDVAAKQHRAWEEENREQERLQKAGDKLLASMWSGELPPAEVVDLMETMGKLVAQSERVIASDKDIINILEEMIENYKQKEALYKEIVAIFENTPGYKKARDDLDLLAERPKSCKIKIHSDATIKSLTVRNRDVTVMRNKEPKINVIRKNLH